jgi:hypothetical protein
MEYSSFFIKHFPIDAVKNDGHDSWIDDPNHIRWKCGFLETIAEHIKNTGKFDPAMIHYHNPNDVSIGNASGSRFWIAKNMWKWEYVPAIVIIKKENIHYIDKMFDVITEITSKEQLRSYLSIEPASYGISDDGRAYWNNQNPNKAQSIATLKVSPQRLAAFLNCLE